MTTKNILWYSELGLANLAEVGGKNASIGEMVSNLSAVGIRVPHGFATTAHAFRQFLAHNRLAERIQSHLEDLDIEDVQRLAAIGMTIRGEILSQRFPSDLEQEIRDAYRQLSSASGSATSGPGNVEDISFAVRSSATAEDLPDASFAGQQETFLNIRGAENVLIAIKEVFASLYNDRAIAYRVHHGFAHADVALSAGIQRMVRADIGATGVIFTIDTESGFRDAILVTSAYGLGEAVVQGSVNPDEFFVYKPGLRAGRPAILTRTVGSKAVKMVYANQAIVGTTIKLVPVDPYDRNRLSLSDDEVEELARIALKIEDHYGRPMDIEWSKDGIDGQMYILQARPETVKSRQSATILQQFQLQQRSTVLLTGPAIGQKIGAGPVRMLRNLEDMHLFETGDVLVTEMTDPDWEPILKRASAIITERGGRTCHAAIIARELGIPAVVGTVDATTKLAPGQPVTVSCAEGDSGFVYDGILDYTIQETETGHMPALPVKIMMNVGTPGQAFAFSQLPNDGVGLARLEFIINRQIGIHPRALLEFDDQSDDVKQKISTAIVAYEGPRDFFVKRVAEGIATIAAAFAPAPVIVRMSDFKSNEYANLVGGERYEPHEENPMLGYRGASRYLSEDFRSCFDLECEAFAHAREKMGLTNIKMMIPFVRTVSEAERVIALLAENGLRRGENGLEVIMMCELPSNALLADAFLDHFDGFSIGSNDMTQLTLGLDRDSALVANTFDERDDAVKALLSMAIAACKRHGKYVGICGQGPSDHADLAQWLLEQGIDSISLNPDTVVDTWLRLGAAIPGTITAA